MCMITVNELITDHLIFLTLLYCHLFHHHHLNTKPDDDLSLYN